MAAISDADASISVTGAIRWTGAATTNRHSVLEFIQWMMKLQDDGVAAGDDILDITVDTPFNRSTDQIVTLNAPFNIDDAFAKHLYDGSVSQTDPTYGGETLYSGLRIIGPVVAGTEYMIFQNGRTLPSFWGTGINPEAAPSLVFSRHLVKSKFAGSQIDGQRIIVLARELGDQYRRFPVTLGAGNAVAAIGNGADIFNITPDATIASWTIVNTEGFQELDLDGSGAAGQEYYSQWDPGAQSVNDTYEYTKWVSQRAHQADVTGGVATGQNNIIDNATILGQAQSFIPLTTGTEKLVEARLNVKIGAGIPTGTLYCELWDSNDAAVGTALPITGALARSADVLASEITSTYEEVIFRFDLKNPSNGVDQAAGLDLANAEYFIVIRNDAGDASNYFHVQGAASDVDATMGSAVDTSGTWGGASANDIYVEVKSCPIIHGMPGERLQGISLDVGYDGEAGTGVAEDSIVLWGTKLWYDGLVGGPFFAGEPVTIRNDADSVLRTGGIILYDDLTDKLIIALDTPGAAVIDDNDIIEGLTSGATAAINVAGGAIEDESLGGGTGLVLAQDDNTGTGEIYLQVLTGVNPVNNSRIRLDDTSGDPLADYVDATAVITPRTISLSSAPMITSGSRRLSPSDLNFNNRRPSSGMTRRLMMLSKSVRSGSNTCSSANCREASAVARLKSRTSPRMRRGNRKLDPILSMLRSSYSLNCPSCDCDAPRSLNSNLGAVVTPESASSLLMLACTTKTRWKFLRPFTMSVK